MLQYDHDPEYEVKRANFIQTEPILKWPTLDQTLVTGTHNMTMTSASVHMIKSIHGQTDINQLTFSSFPPQQKLDFLKSMGHKVLKAVTSQIMSQVLKAG